MQSREIKLLSIVLPTLNERENVRAISIELRRILNDLNIDFEIIFVDDNSPDGTVNVLQDLHKTDSRIKHIIMTRRFGDQAALLAGIQHSSGDAVIMMDADFQHPPRYIEPMVAEWKKGSEIVVMQREQEGHKSFFKKYTEIYFYNFMSFFTDELSIKRFSGFALIDKKVVKALRQFPERSLYLRGLIPLTGFSLKTLPYLEDSRKVGVSKFGVFEMMRLALDGITSFTAKPLYISGFVGLFFIFMAILLSLKIGIYDKFILGVNPPGYTSLALIILFSLGLQLGFLGLIGLYIGRILFEVKSRPHYLILDSTFSAPNQ